MSKKVAVILIIVAVVLCTVPSLVFSGLEFGGLRSNPQIVATSMAQSQKPDSLPISNATATTLAWSLGGLVILFGLAVPVIVGILTFWMARKKATQTPPPH